MISRRGLFRLLTGAGLSPVLKPLAALIPKVSTNWKGECDHPFCQPSTGNPVGICLVGQGPSEVMRIWYDTHGREMKELRRRFTLTEMSQLKMIPENTGKKLVLFNYNSMPSC